MTVKRTAVFACDNNYAGYLATTIASLIDNFESSLQLEIIIFDAGIKNNSKDSLLKLSTDNISIHFFPIEEQIFSDFPLTISHISLATYFRLKLPSLLNKHDKVVYLDVDVLINKDISDMWNIDLQGHSLGAVIEPRMSFTQYDYLEKIGLTEKKHLYFNAGVLIMDLNCLRDINFEEKVANYLFQYKDVIEYQDQDILNGVLQGNVHYISPKYNFMPEYRTILKPNRIWMLDKLPYTKSEIESLRSNANIYHYCGKRKAWMYSCTHDGADLYIKYQNSTDWAGDSYSDLRELSIFKKLSLWAKKRFY
ncbi:glycosyltransferase family 8 protein [Aliivibrio sifiae]|uniref:Glycosyltransferase n=1 Tax=Aliivibrio sifiae TaxID=566293 RepID=A0A2S7X594_9GAMM|nr:glycosyltransferase family 8 protein [Aliivibrio sifiae]PQJ85427.1 hypothetical protein BTO23_19100 [Aliivibrio sifiae]GLR76391.1 putative glycosyltransferase [Aliivibrio sifiae]